VIRPVGCGTLLGMLRPKLGLPYERGEFSGAMLWAVIEGRVKLPSGGRGTDRDSGEAEGILPPDLAIGLLGCDGDRTPPCGGRGMPWFRAICVGRGRAGSEVRPRPKDPGLEFPRLAGGRGMKRPADGGIDVALAGRPSGMRAVGIVLLRAAGLPKLREAGCVAAGLEDIAGGVIRLKVGREAVDNDGRAEAFGPSMASRLGVTFGLPMLAMLRNAPGEILAAFGATGSPR
jgi:hypothetical protein